VATTYYDAITGLPKKRGQLTPDTDPTGRYGLGTYGAAPTGGGISPTGASSYASLLTLPGTQPDFLGILNSDPLLQQFRSNLGAESVADRAGLAAARQQALARFGLIPENLSNTLGIAGSDLMEDVTPEVRALASQNTAEGLSTIARINRERERAQQNIMDVLAGRGALRSGATGVALSDLQQDYKQTVSDAESQLLDYLQGLSQGFIQGQRQRAQQLAQEQAAAAGRIDPSRLAGTPGVTARHVGNGLYVDDQGNYYDVNGNRISPPSQALPEPPPLAPTYTAPQGVRRAPSGGRLSEYAL